MKPPRAIDLEVLREMGFRLWDPLGVADYEGCEDEYDSYLLQAFGSLRRGEDPGKVTSYLVGVEVGPMGLGPSPFATERAAALVDELAVYAASLRDGPLRGGRHNLTDCPITFPAIAISPGQHPWVPEGVEELHRLDTAFELTRGTEEENTQRLSWEIFDATGAQWKIADSPRLGPRRGLLTAEFEFAPRFERTGKVRLGELKARIVAAVRGTPELFLEDEILAGEANYPIEDSGVLLDALCARIERSRSFKSAYEAVWADQIDLDVVKSRPEAEDAERRRQTLVFWIRLLWWSAVAIVLFALGVRFRPSPFDELIAGAGAAVVIAGILYLEFHDKFEVWWSSLRRKPGP